MDRIGEIIASAQNAIQSDTHRRTLIEAEEYIGGAMTTDTVSVDPSKIEARKFADTVWGFVPDNSNKLKGEEIEE